MIRKIVFWFLVICLASFVVSRPDKAGDMALDIGAGIVKVFNGLGDFLERVF